MGSGDQRDICQPLPDPPPGGREERRGASIGCMTGTSLDGLDCALVEISGLGLPMRATFVRGNSTDLGAFKPRLRAIADQVPVTAGEVAGVMRAFAVLHADAVRELLAGEACDLVCVHGQTVFHKPPLSWQLFQPAPLVQSLRVPVVYDLRQADLALGGQGAPITPIADWVFFGEQIAPATIVNLGGFCNITTYPEWHLCEDHERSHEDRVRLIQARDVCACNQLLDAVARVHLARPFDVDGTAAMRGMLCENVFSRLVSILTSQVDEGRSLGTGDELTRLVASLSAPRPEDIARSACEAIAEVVCGRSGDVHAAILAGGGTRNRALVRAFQQRAPHVRLSGDFGLPVEFREAACFAVLGALCQDRVPITLPQVTKLPAGVAAPLSGVWAFP